jgi:hypothetical protein
VTIAAPHSRPVVARRPGLRLPSLGGRQVWTDCCLRHGYRVQVHAWARGLHRLLDPRDRQLALGSGRRMRAAFERLALPGHAAGKPCVVALHGLARSRASFAVMAAELPGFEFVGLDYASIWAMPEVHGCILAEVLATMEARPRFDLVAFSMGNLVARFCLDHLARLAPQRLAEFGRLIMIAPPNRGAAPAELLHRLAPRATPPALRGLSASVARAAPRPALPTFVIAGEGGPRFPGWWEQPNDGLIRVADTAIDGMVEQVVVPAAHFLMLRDPRVIALTADFLTRPLLPVNSAG